ncbi:MAG: class I SAM-dependent methyltransferase [Pseudomonadota bacterium]
MDASEALEAAFGKAAPDHFDWQTTSPVVSDRERELVRSAFLPLGTRVLDLGCGEGATLFHLDAPKGATGIDLFPDKIRFAREQLPGCHFVAGSVYELPFADGAFDHLLVRDVIHHLEEPQRFVKECRRVLGTGGRIDILEPCRYNPLIALHAVMNRAERGELRSTEPFLTGLLQGSFRIENVTRHQPLPVHRLVYHPKLGNPEFARSSAISRVVDAVERSAGRLMPKGAWAYLHVRAAVQG